LTISGNGLTISGSVLTVTGGELEASIRYSDLAGNRQDAEFQQMDRLLAEFRLAILKRRVAINISKVSTGNIDGIFKAQDKLLKEQVDSLMEPFQFSQPDFFSAYRNARSVVDYAGRGKAAPATPVASPV
jgi:hypothetical protein